MSEFEPTRWWRVAGSTELWCETSNEEQARDALPTCPYGEARLYRLYERVEREWRAER